MAGWAEIMVRDRRRLIVLTLVAIVLLAGLVLSVDRVMYARALAQEKAVARDDAAILAAGLRSELDKVSLLPITLAGDLQVRELLAGDPSHTRLLDTRLENLARQSGAAAIYVMDKDGLTHSASNWNQPASFVGSNYAFRHYFRQALNAGTSTEFALGTVSRKPGMYIANRAGSATNPLGVVAVKIEFDALEASWRKATDGVYVTDASGVVLLATDAGWRFRLAREGVGRKRDDGKIDRFGNALDVGIGGQALHGRVLGVDRIEFREPGADQQVNRHPADAGLDVRSADHRNRAGLEQGVQAHAAASLRGAPGVGVKSYSAGSNFSVRLR